jgi:hypothetical protein
LADNRFTWIPAYEKIADALYTRRDKRDELREVYVDLTGADDREEIDPLTFFTSFNRGIISVDRRSMVRTILRAFNIEAPVPTDFIGIPTANHELWQYYDNTSEAAEDCWELFSAALELADAEDPSIELADRFCESFDKVHSQENITKARLTRTLYWMRPSFYLPFGEKTREFVHGRFGLETPIVMKGRQYLRLLQEMDAVCDDEFYEVAAHAYHVSHEDVWWPDIRDYDPDMSIHQWMVLLSDPEITSEEVLDALRKIRDAGGDSTLEEIAEERGRDREYYGQLLRGYARDTSREMGRGEYRGSWWPFIFVGRNAEGDREGDYIWKMRPEVLDALNAIDKGEVLEDGEPYDPE